VTDGPEIPLTGGCNCEAVRYEIREELLGALLCHCRRCQRRTGTAFSAVALTAPGSFEVVAGESDMRSWDPGGGGWTKHFCGGCGGQLFVTDPGGRLLGVHLGSLDGDPGVRPGAHQFTDEAAPWLPVADDGLPHFGGRLPSYEPG
jgi:hypothetical protein